MCRQPGSKHVQSLSPDSSAVQCLRLCQGTANAAVATLMGMYFLHDLTSSSSPAGVLTQQGPASLLRLCMQFKINSYHRNWHAA